MKYLWLCLFAVAAQGQTIKDAIKSAPAPDSVAIRNWLAEPTGWTNVTVTTITTNDTTLVARRQFLTYYGGKIGATNGMSDADVFTLWTAAITNSTLSPQYANQAQRAALCGTWYAAYTSDKILQIIPAYETNTVTYAVPTKYRWEDLKLKNAPQASDIEAAQKPSP
jgi:hypothetical protein